MARLFRSIALRTFGLLLLAALVALQPLASSSVMAACAPEDKIDSSTAQWAQQQAEQAGYSNVRMERKGCDNYWHGHGEKDGQPVNLVVSPQGRVLEEGD